MMNIPAKIMERSAELDRVIEAHDAAIRVHESELRAEHAELSIAIALRRELDFAVSILAPLIPNAEAGEGERAAAATPGTPGVENAPAGSVGASAMEMQREVGRSWAQDRLARSVEPKKPRAPKRDIRGMVLDFFDAERSTARVGQISDALAVPLRTIEKAVAYWQVKGRLTLEGGVVMLRTEPTPKESDSVPLTHNDPGEPPEEPYPDVGIWVDGPGVRDMLIAFLKAEPDSTMAEINATGIPAPEVYRAEKDGVVIAKAHGLYALAEPKAEAAE